MSVSKHATYNLIGTAIPSVLTLISVPLYLHLVGVERYGMLTLCWVILGYSTFLDLGLGFAVARGVAAAGKDDEAMATSTFWTAAWISLTTGTVGAVAVYFGARLYFSALETAGSMDAEIVEALPLLAAAVPLAMVASVVLGAMQGRERFLAINVVGTAGQAMVALLPLLFAYLWSPTLSVLIAGALLGRIISLIWAYRICKRAVPLRSVQRPSGRIARNLLTFGGWVVLTTIANGLLQTVDRMAIGGAIGATAVATYAISYGLVSRIYLIPHGLSSALLPRYAAAGEEERARMVRSSIQAVAVVTTPAIIALVAFVEPFFNIWIGRELTVAAAPVAYVLAGGFWIYCVAHMTYTMVQATGRPDRVGKLLMAEVVPYAIVLFAGMWAFGLVGAAAAFTLRVLVDFALQVRLARIPGSVLRMLLLPGALTFVSVAVAAGLSGGARYSAFAILLLASAAWSIRNMPEALRPHLQKLLSILPLRGREASKLP